MAKDIILLVTNIKEHISQVQNALASGFYKVHVAKTNAQAQELVKNTQPAAMVLDLLATELPHAKMINFIKTHNQAGDVPLLYITGKEQLSQGMQHFTPGKADYLIVPFTKEELHIRLKNLLVYDGAVKDVEAKAREVEVVNQFKDQMFSIISHDLKGPLGSIKTLLDVISKESRENKSYTFQQNDLDLLSQTTDKAYTLLENLLMWSSSQRNTITMDKNNLRLYQLIDELVSLFGAKASEKNITITNQVEEDFFVYADKQMLHTVLRNLISNAVKFAPKNGSVGIHAQKQNNGAARIAVSDNGRGIPEKIQKHILSPDKFYTSYGTAYEKGSGLGLKLCKEFIEKMDGILNINSVENKGSEFYFILPPANT